MKYLIGYDIGTSSVKASLVEAEGGECVASAQWPDTEAGIISLRPGWAEQEPSQWWEGLKMASRRMMAAAGEARPGEDFGIAAIGITYQMHGLVCLDARRNVLRPSIIWCDSRAVPYGDKALAGLGKELCLSHLLNSPGNFTAAKLAWVKDNEPEVYARIDKIALPGDYIAYKLTGELCTTVSGLSEGMFWDFREGSPAKFLMDWFGFDEGILPEVRPTFSVQGRLSGEAAAELGLKAGIPISYRAGDQPNNALSLNVFEPGEIASTAGTSGVVYGVSDNLAYDPLSRVNSFAHVNHGAQTRLGVLLCINGTGILNSWVRRNVVPRGLSYAEMNAAADEIPAGCDGVGVLPFGNGAERMLCNRPSSCRLYGIDFNRHDWRHIVRAVQEGIACSFRYGIDIMEGMGLRVRKIHAGKANMFLNRAFREALAAVTGATIELYDTDGSAGAARGAGMGAGLYKDHNEAFATLRKLDVVEPERAVEYAEVYARWKSELENSPEGRH